MTNHIPNMRAAVDSAVAIARKRGHPFRVAGQRTTTIFARVTDDERSALEGAARREGLTLSEWLRGVAMAAASR